MLSNQDVTQRVAYNLRSILADQELSQTELSKRTGDSVMVVNDLVHGRVLPNVATVARIADALGVSIETLLAPPKKRSLPPIRRGPKPGTPRKVPA